MSTPATTVSAPPEGAGGLIGWAKHTAARNARRTTNAVRLAAGLDQPRTGCTPHVTLWRYDRVSLRRYRAGMNDGRPPLLLVPSLINRSHIWDLRPGDSFVEGLLADGYDVFLIDWAHLTIGTRTTPSPPMSTVTYRPLTTSLLPTPGYGQPCSVTASVGRLRRFGPPACQTSRRQSSR